MNTIRRGDRIRQMNWTKCYLFVTKTCPGLCHVIGIVYEPQHHSRPIIRERGVWANEGWVRWYPGAEAARGASAPLP